MFKNTTIGRVIMEFINHDHSVEKTASVKMFDLEEAQKTSASLEKLASLPYKQEAYEATQGIMKIASEIMSEAARAIESSNKRISDLEKFAEIHSIIDEMIEDGMIDKGDTREKIAELLQKKDLDVVKQAMEMIKGKSGNIFFETEDTNTSGGHEKRGMFDGVIDV